VPPGAGGTRLLAPVPPACWQQALGPLDSSPCGRSSPPLGSLMSVSGGRRRDGTRAEAVLLVGQLRDATQPDAQRAAVARCAELSSEPGSWRICGALIQASAAPALVRLAAETHAGVETRATAVAALSALAQMMYVCSEGKPSGLDGGAHEALSAMLGAAAATLDNDDEQAALAALSGACVRVLHMHAKEGACARLCDAGLHLHLLAALQRNSGADAKSAALALAIMCEDEAACRAVVRADGFAVLVAQLYKTYVGIYGL
jgi:hypothetical protein